MRNALHALETDWHEHSHSQSQSCLLLWCCTHATLLHASLRVLRGALSTLRWASCGYAKVVLGARGDLDALPGITGHRMSSRVLHYQLNALRQTRGADTSRSIAWALLGKRSHVLCWCGKLGGCGSCVGSSRLTMHLASSLITHCKSAACTAVHARAIVAALNQCATCGTNAQTAGLRVQHCSEFVAQLLLAWWLSPSRSTDAQL